MASRELNKSDWQNFFDNFSKKHSTVLINLEIVGKEVGDQTEINWQPLRGISLDPRNDRFFIQTDLIEHSISHPKKVQIEEQNGELKSIQIIDQENNRQIVRLKEQSPNAS